MLPLLCTIIQSWRKHGISSSIKTTIANTFHLLFLFLFRFSLTSIIKKERNHKHPSASGNYIVIPLCKVSSWTSSLLIKRKKEKKKSLTKLSSISYYLPWYLPSKFTHRISTLPSWNRKKLTITPLSFYPQQALFLYIFSSSSPHTHTLTNHLTLTTTERKIK